VLARVGNIGENPAYPQGELRRGAWMGISTETNDLAWLGDAVLALYMRQLLLKNFAGRQLGPLFQKITSNQFLSSFGEPTRFEASIGLVYEQKGFAAAMQFVEANVLPTLSSQFRNGRFGDFSQPTGLFAGEIS
jgi:dsRNA-specific ribonuclease